MNPFEKLGGKNLSSSSVMEGIDHLRKNLDNISQKNYDCSCDRGFICINN
jgi:hypothetical protein